MLAGACSPLRTSLSRSASPPRNPRTPRGSAAQRAMDAVLGVLSGQPRPGGRVPPGACSGRRGYAQPAQAPNTALRGAARPSGPCPACGFRDACAHTCPARAAAEGLTAQRTDNMDRRRCPQAETQKVRTSEQDAPGEPGAMRGSGREASARRSQCRRCGRRRSSSGAGQGSERSHAGTAAEGLPHGGSARRHSCSSTSGGSERRSAPPLARSDAQHEQAKLTSCCRLPGAHSPALHGRTVPAWVASGGDAGCVTPPAPVCGRGARHGGDSHPALRMTQQTDLLSGLRTGMDALAPAWPPDACEWG